MTEHKAETVRKNYGGYEITVEQVKSSGRYKLTARVYSMGEEYLESMLADDYDDETLAKFVRQIERGR